MLTIMAVLLLAWSCREQTSMAVEPVPPALNNYLKANFPDWSVVDTADYDKSWWSFYDTHHIPWIVHTDINDDQLADHALLLKQNNRLRLVICMGAPQNTFSHVVVEGFNQMEKLQYGLAVQAPGQIDVLQPQEQSLLLLTNGIALMELEQTSRIYYWQNGIQTFYMK
jgi:hypothetical protein